MKPFPTYLLPLAKTDYSPNDETRGGFCEGTTTFHPPHFEHSLKFRNRTHVPTEWDKGAVSCWIAYNRAPTDPLLPQP